MSAHTPALLELCADYVLGTIAPADRARLEAHLADGCAECEAELTALSEGAFLLAASAPPVAAPRRVRERVLAAVNAEPQRPSARVAPLPVRPRASRMAWVWAAAAAFIAAFSIGLWRDVQRAERQLGEARTQMGQLEQELANERRWAETLAAPGAHVVALATTPATQAPLIARVTFDPATRRAVVVCDHFAPPAGHDYQLWAISDQGPASLGVVHADANGHAQVRIDNAGDPAKLAAFAVSLENQGGAPTPTAPAGPVVMVGKI